MRTRHFCLVVLGALCAVAATDLRPSLVAAGRSRASRYIEKSPEREAERRLQQATRAVGEAARMTEAAKKSLRDARRAARDAADDLEAMRERAAKERRTSTFESAMAKYKREVRNGR